MKTAMNARLNSSRIFSTAFFMSAFAIASGEAGFWGGPTTCSAQQIASCGCEVVEPTCGAPTCNVPCNAACEPSCGLPFAGNCEDSGCDGRGGCGHSSNSARRFTLPGIGEGLLAGLDKMTDRFENGMGRLMNPVCRSKNNCDSCSNSTDRQCQSNNLGGYTSSMADDIQEASTDDSHQTSGLPRQPIVPPSPVEINSFEPASTDTHSGNDVPVAAPMPPQKMPGSEAQGNPFLDEARARPRNLPEIHVAKVQTTIRGSTRRRYAPQNQPSVIEAVAPEGRSLPDVITAGAMQQSHAPANVYSR